MARALRLNNYGAALERLGRKDEARDAYRHAIRMDPSLDVSKRNLHANVNRALGRGTLVAGGVAVAFIKFAGIGAATGANTLRGLFDPSSMGLAPVVVLLIVILAAWGGRHLWIAHRARQREAELEARDPELMRMYRQIDEDLASGRTRRK